ncbi:MAG: hypothetical protein ACM359_18350 [Bacillota bacterium]
MGFKLIPKASEKPDKRPITIADPSQNAKCNAPDTWGTFDDALRQLEDRRCSAIGYALNNDIVGIDLDGARWIRDDGSLTDEAQDLVRRCGSYAERSVSGRGLHILLRGKLSGSGHRNGASGVEVYGAKRFFIVTGDQIKGTTSEVNENPAFVSELTNLAKFPDVAERAEQTEMAEKQREAEDGFCLSALSALSATPDAIVAKTIPSQEGERNACLMKLARGLKFDAGLKDQPLREVRPWFNKWYGKAKSIIGTKSTEENWADFVHAWNQAKYPLGVDIRQVALERAKANPLSDEWGYESDIVRLLGAWCRELASFSDYSKPDGRFFLGSHDAGKRLGIEPKQAGRYLEMFCAEGVLELIEKGTPGLNGRANRYRWIGRQNQGTRDK